MKKHYLLITLLFILVLASSSYAQSVPPLKICEPDSFPCVTNATRLNFPNGTLTVAGSTVTYTPASGAGTGTVTSVSVTTANGVSGSVATATTTPAITLTLGAITPTTVNKLTFTPPATGATLTLIDGTTVTGPSATTTLPGLSLSNTFTAKQIITPAVNTNALASTGYSLTGSNASSLIDLAGTWNTSGVPTLIKANVTNTASGSGSLLIDLQVGGSSKFSVSKGGAVTTPDVFTALGGNFTGSLMVGPTATDLVLGSTGQITIGDQVNSFIIVKSSGQNIWHANPNDLTIDTTGIMEFGDAPTGAVRIKLTPASDLMQFFNAAGSVSFGDLATLGSGTAFSVDSGASKFTFINGVVAVGTATPDASALITMSSTTLGFLPPRVTTTQRDAISSPSEGLTVFNLTTHVPNYWTGSAWSAGIGAPFTDATAIIKGSSDTSKLLRIEVDGFTTSTTRVLTPPDADTIIPIATQQLTFAGPTASRTITFPDAAITVARTDAANTFTGVQTMTSPSVTTSLVTASTTFALVNATATTINFAGAATALNIGASATTILNFGGSTTAAEFRFLEPSGSGTNYSAFKAVAQGASITYSLPPTVGAAGTVLTDVAGDGVLTWAAGGGGGTPGGSDTQLQRNNAGAFGGISGATTDGTNVNFGGGNLLATSPVFTTDITTPKVIGGTASAGNLLLISTSHATLGLVQINGTAVGLKTGTDANGLAHLIVARGDNGATASLMTGTLAINPNSSLATNTATLLFDSSRSQAVFGKDWTVGFAAVQANPGVGNSMDVNFYRSAANVIGIGINGSTPTGSLTLLNLTAAGSFVNSGITADTAHTDTAVCQDTTSHQFYSGTGTLGVCLGTSTLRAKRNIIALDLGLSELMRLRPISFSYREGWGYDSRKTYYGFGAEDVRPVLPNLTPLNAAGQPNSVDMMGMVPVVINAIQQQQAEIENLRSRVKKLEARH